LYKKNDREVPHVSKLRLQEEIVAIVVVIVVVVAVVVVVVVVVVVLLLLVVIATAEVAGWENGIVLSVKINPVTETNKTYCCSFR
jgi:uncharacterized membrane protein